MELTLQKVVNEIDHDNEVQSQLMMHWILTRFGEVQGRLVIALLLLDGGPVTHSKMIEMIWGEDIPASVDECLRYAIYKVRSKLEDEGEGMEIVTHRRAAQQGRRETEYTLGVQQP